MILYQDKQFRYEKAFHIIKFYGKT